MGFNLQYGQSGVWYGQFSSFPSDWMQHGISTRFGGTSEDEFAGLNLAMHTGDDIEAVRENRRRFAGALGLSADTLVTAQQVHGERILRVDASHAGSGALSYEDALADVDALITNEPNLPLMLFFADCVPVFIIDPINQAIAVVHAGWKGTVAHIAAKTLTAMQREFGTKADKCLVGIGPSIGACCYEIGEAVAMQFYGSFPDEYEEICTSFQARRMVDLWEANRIQLMNAGIPRENIEIAGACTCCNPQVFYSYRADKGKTGRIAAVISLQK